MRHALVVLLVCLAVSLSAQPVDVLTQHNDFDRTGHNARETVLTPASVKKSFGRLYDLDVDAQVYAQPLVVTGLQSGGLLRNVLIVATDANTIYYFDADNGGAPIWSKNYGPASPSPNEFWNVPRRWNPYRDMTPLIGIVSTPVVDRKSNTLYFTAYTQTPPARPNLPPKFTQWVHAIDLSTHAEKFGSPIEVIGVVSAPASTATTMAMAEPMGNSKRHYHARGGASSLVVFEPRIQMQRPGLLLVNGRLVVAFASHGDFDDYHGWVFSYDAQNLRNKPGIWLSTPDLNNPRREAVQGGIWQSGMGLTTDVNGYVYLMTGNGNFDQQENFGDTVIKLQITGDTITRVDTFTPCDQAWLADNDLDLGSSGVMHPPGSNFIVGGGKQGALYVMNTSGLGGYNPNGGSPDCTNKVQQQVQVSCPVQTSDTGHIHGSPVYWESDVHGPTIYVWCENDYLRALTWNKTTSMLAPTSCESPSWPAWAKSDVISPTTIYPGMTGGMLSISSNGTKNGIVWATTPYNNNANQLIVPGILYAFDANDLSKPIWNSYAAAQYRDLYGNYAKFTPVTVANGKVYVPTFSNHVSVYGLNPPAPPAPVTNLLTNGDFENGATGWTLTSGAQVVNAPADNGYPYLGANSAQLISQNAQQSISQTVTAPATGTYELSAFCLTTFVAQFVAPNSAGGILGVSINGAAPMQQFVTSYSGYLPYAIQFSANSGDKITVSYTAPQWPDDYPTEDWENTWSYIDTVVLRQLP